MTVALRVQPGASRSQIDGPGALADGTTVLSARVGAPPEAGKANAAAIKLLAKAWRLPKGSLRIVAGHGKRRKTLLVIGDPVALQARLEAWLAGFVGSSEG